MQADLQSVFTNTHESLFDISQNKPIMLVFLRHFGCIFCREALNDLAEKRSFINSKNIELIFVHMSSIQDAESYFTTYNLANVKHISNPDCKLYQDFGLSKGNFGQLFGLKTWIRGFEAKRRGIEASLKQIGDSLQMPGIFFIKSGEIVDSYIHKNASDRPDYDKMIESLLQS